MSTPQQHPPDRDPTVDSAVTAAISQAKEAALKAGVGVRPRVGDEPEDNPADGIRVSFAFDLEGVASAQSLIAVEQALEEIPGVAATLVYPTATAWITATKNSRNCAFS